MSRASEVLNDAADRLARLCGDHDARQCPNPLCEEVFEHVWGAPRIQAANENRKQGS